jgi:hypothetical protein
VGDYIVGEHTMGGRKIAHRINTKRDKINFTPKFIPKAYYKDTKFSSNRRIFRPAVVAQLILINVVVAFRGLTVG